MDPISSPELNSEAPQAGAPGQVIGPGGSVMPSQPAAPQPQAQPLPPPSAGPAVTIVPTSAPAVPAVTAAPAPDQIRPIAVGDAPLPASSVILPPQTATFGAMSFNETAGSAKTPFIKKLAGKKLILMVGLPLVVLGSSAAAYFGYVVPNQPDNVWAKALSNTGKGYDKLTDYTQKQIYSTQYKGIKEDGTFKIGGSFVADGDFHGASSGDNGEFSGNLSASGVKLSLDMRVIKPASADAPDLYLKVDGLDSLAGLLGGDTSSYGDLIKKVDGNWYFVDHTLLEQYASAFGSTSTDMKLTQSDVKSILDAVGSAGRQNLFTTDQSKMAFQVRQKIGKEKIDGRNTYHFKVGIDKDNLKSYVTTLCSNLKSSNLKKVLGSDNGESTLNSGCSSLQDSVSNIKGDKTADAWVDLRTKLIHKIRFTDSTSPGSYFDIGQDYQGGDNFPFSLTNYDKQADNTTTTSVTVNLNMKTNLLNIKGSIKEVGSDPATASLDLTIAPSNEKVTVQKPDGATNVLDLINDLGFGDFISNDTSSGATDSERKTDINAMHSQAEAYWATNGYYPSLANMNDPNWVAANLVGMDPEALKDPAGSSGKLAAAPAANVYAYQATPAGCDNVKAQCQGYTLTATLNDGSTYVKQSLDDGSTSILN